MSAGGDDDEQRREMLIQSALLGAGSLEPSLVRALRARPFVARRYLALEGHRALNVFTDQVPLAAALGAGRDPVTVSAEESLQLARGRTRVTDPPEWFGVIRPSRLLAPPVESRAGEQQLRLDTNLVEAADDENDEDGSAEESKILKLFDNPLLNSQTLSRFLRKLLGTAGSSGDSNAGGEMPIGAVRRMHAPGVDAKPLPTRIHFTDDNNPGANVGVCGALYPEWDLHHGRYRSNWCRVINFPVAASPDSPSGSAPRDEVLRRRLSRIGLGPKLLRARPDGDELDIDALINLFGDLRSGYSPPENVYAQRRNLARNLGVLILLDASGSANETNPGGLAVHDHQRRAACTLAETLEELGDRVALYGFRSQSRHAVHLLAIKKFAQRFGALERARLSQLRPSGYTRLGAGIRGAGDILRSEAGTPHRLLVVLSDGYPYDDGYEGRYAEEDSRQALEELRADGVACLGISIGTTAGGDELSRVFGTTGHASAGVLSDLSPRMDQLFLSSLRELAAPKPL